MRWSIQQSRPWVTDQPRPDARYAVLDALPATLLQATDIRESTVRCEVMFESLRRRLPTSPSSIPTRSRVAEFARRGELDRAASPLPETALLIKKSIGSGSLPDHILGEVLIIVVHPPSGIERPLARRGCLGWVARRRREPTRLGRPDSRMSRRGRLALGPWRNRVLCNLFRVF